VGLGAAMGTEAPAAYLGVATGAALGDRWWRRLVRPLAVGGGAAGVAVLMGIPLVGTAYIIELGRRHHAPLNAERVTAALVGGLVGWLLNVSLGSTSTVIRILSHAQPTQSLPVPRVVRGNLGPIMGLAIDDNGIMYAADFTSSSKIYSVDRATGVATQLFDTGTSHVHNIAFNPGSPSVARSHQCFGSS